MGKITVSLYSFTATIFVMTLPPPLFIGNYLQSDLVYLFLRPQPVWVWAMDCGLLLICYSSHVPAITEMASLWQDFLKLKAKDAETTEQILFRLYKPVSFDTEDK